jgi:hypothetical protein
MALLVICEDDFLNGEMPQVNIRKVGDLLNPPENDVDGPLLTSADLLAHESVDDLCNVIDLPGRLFLDIVPDQSDLPLLAHVREVSTDDKETTSLQSEGCFAVVIANRFPVPGEDTGANMALLVSLEGWQNWIDETEKPLSPMVRLGVLANWSFGCQAGNTFKSLVDKLKPGLLQLPLPSTKPESDTISTAYEFGYTALRHQLRNYPGGHLRPIPLLQYDPARNLVISSIGHSRCGAR